MLIDWYTVSFQIVNFLILVALLKRFLYGPIIKAMDEREKTIAASLADAQRASTEAEAKALLLAKEQDEFSQSRRRMEDAALQEINDWKEASIVRAKNDIASQRNVWQQNLADEQDAFLMRLGIHINQQVFLVAQKAMADLADASLENSLLETFLQKINHEPGTPAQENTGSKTTLRVTTGFPVTLPQQEDLQKKLGRSFPLLSAIDFQEDDRLGFGIHLLAGDLKWEWNLSRYMRDIEKDIIKNMKITATKSS